MVNSLESVFKISVFMVENALYAWTGGANGGKKSPFSKISGYMWTGPYRQSCTEYFIFLSNFCDLPDALKILITVHLIFLVKKEFIRQQPVGRQATAPLDYDCN